MKVGLALVSILNLASFCEEEAMKMLVDLLLALCLLLLLTSGGKRSGSSLQRYVLVCARAHAWKCKERGGMKFLLSFSRCRIFFLFYLLLFKEDCFSPSNTTSYSILHRENDNKNFIPPRSLMPFRMRLDTNAIGPSWKWHIKEIIMA